MTPGANHVAIEYGEVAAGGFFGAMRLEVDAAELWDGYGWHLPAVQAVVEALRPDVPRRSKVLEKARSDITRAMQKSLHRRDERGLAALIRLAEELRAATVLQTLIVVSRTPALSASLRDTAHQARWAMAYERPAYARV